jgi:hypothetical protein
MTDDACVAGSLNTLQSVQSVAQQSGWTGRLSRWQHAAPHCSPIVSLSSA